MIIQVLSKKGFLDLKS
uniref:Uncharacterized protein n=1 Tax=Arundo donax TaxID=35708 RepID=A0A0A9C6R6_ARUDO